MVIRIGLIHVKRALPHRGGQNSRLSRQFQGLEFQKIVTVLHFHIFLIKFDQIPLFCHNRHDFQIDFTKVVWFPHFNKILQSGFPGKFCNKFCHPLWGEGIFNLEKLIGSDRSFINLMLNLTILHANFDIKLAILNLI